MARSQKKTIQSKDKIIFLFLGFVILWLLLNLFIHFVQNQFVHTQTVVSQRMEDTLTGYGLIQGGESTVIAQGDGTVEPIVKEGERVRKGNAVCKISGAISYTNYAGKVSYELDGLEGVTDLNSVCMTDLERRYKEQKKGKDNRNQTTFSAGDVCAKVTNIFDDVYLYLTVPMNDFVASMEPGNVLPVRFQSLDYEMKGTLQERLDTQDGHSYLKIKLRGAKEIVFNQRLHEVVIPYNQVTSIVVPQSALVERDGEIGIYYLSKGFVFWKAVTPGETRGDQVLIQEGLKPGNIIVTTPKLVRVGSKVRNVDSK